MKSKTSSLAAISLALLLCSCGNNDDEPKNTEPTDAITTAISFTEAPAETSAEEAETVFTDSPADILLVSNAQMLDTLTYNGEKLIRLYFLGDKNGDTWSGSLSCVTKLPIGNTSYITFSETRHLMLSHRPQAVKMNI